MTTFLVCTAIYFAIAALSIWISGRQVWQGWLLFMFIWPIGWLFMGPDAVITAAILIAILGIPLALAWPNGWAALGFAALSVAFLCARFLP